MKNKHTKLIFVSLVIALAFVCLGCAIAKSYGYLSIDVGSLLAQVGANNSAKIGIETVPNGRFQPGDVVTLKPRVSVVLKKSPSVNAELSSINPASVRSGTVSYMHYDRPNKRIVYLVELFSSTMPQTSASLGTAWVMQDQLAGWDGARVLPPSLDTYTSHFKLYNRGSGYNRGTFLMLNANSYLKKSVPLYILDTDPQGGITSFVVYGTEADLLVNAKGEVTTSNSMPLSSSQMTVPPPAPTENGFSIDGCVKSISDANHDFIPGRHSIWSLSISLQFVGKDCDNKDAWPTLMMRGVDSIEPERDDPVTLGHIDVAVPEAADYISIPLSAAPSGIQEITVVKSNLYKEHGLPTEEGNVSWNEIEMTEIQSGWRILLASTLDDLVYLRGLYTEKSNCDTHFGGDCDQLILGQSVQRVQCTKYGTFEKQPLSCAGEVFDLGSQELTMLVDHALADMLLGEFLAADVPWPIPWPLPPVEDPAAATVPATINSLKAPVVNFGAGDFLLNGIGQTHVKWSATGAVSCTSSWAGSVPLSGTAVVGPFANGAVITLTCTGESGLKTGRSFTVSPYVSSSPQTTTDPAPTTVSEPAPASAGEAQEETQTNTVSSAPAITIGIANVPLTASRQSTVKWTTSNTRFCVAYGHPTWTGTKATSGTALVGPFDAPVTLYLICAGTDGTSLRKGVSVTATVARANTYNQTATVVNPLSNLLRVIFGN